MNQANRKKRVEHHRIKVRANGGIILYATITSPEAIKAWKMLQEIYGSNRDAIEASLIDSYENLTDGS